MGRSSLEEGDFAGQPQPKEVAQLILKGISMMLELAKHVSSDELTERLTLAQEEALRQVALLDAGEPPAH